MSKPTIAVVCRGLPRELGRTQGEALAKQIHGTREILADLEAFRLMQPAWLPYPIFRWISERKARALEAPLRQQFSGSAERLEGMARGAGIDLNSLYLLNALEAVMSSTRECTRAPLTACCSALAIRGARSKDGQPAIARNFDYLPLVQPFYMVRDCHPEGGFRSLEFTCAPLVGAVDGVNERGLGISYDYAFTTDEGPPAATISMAISEAFSTCTTAEQAAEQISSTARWGGGILMIADADGNLISLELSNTRAALRRPDPGVDVLHHTNAFSEASMREVEIATEACYDDRAPTPLRGCRVLESPQRRDARFVELLSDGTALGLDDLTRILADHGNEGQPDDGTLCMHSGYWNTTATIQVLPRSRTLRVSYANACRADYADFSL